jgi:hypothetical protein
MGRVTETLENPHTTADPVVHADRSHRLYRALAWVGIAAGSLFIVATVFFSGYILGSHGGGSHGHHMMMLKPFPGPDGRRGPGGPMGPGGPTGPDDGPRNAPLTPSSPTSAPPRS